MVIDALAEGIARQKLADPDAVPDELMGEVIVAAAPGGYAPGGRHRPRSERVNAAAPARARGGQAGAHRPLRRRGAAGERPTAKKR